MENAKAQKALRIANELAKEAMSSVDFHNAFFGIGGKFGELFPTLAERRAFAKTREYQKILELRTELSRVESVFLQLDLSLGSARFVLAGEPRGPVGYVFLPADQVVDEFLTSVPAHDVYRERLIDQLMKSRHVENGMIRVPKSSQLGERLNTSSKR
jgi:hypothetical protein